MIHNEENISVDASRLDALIPVPPKRPTLQGADEEYASAPNTNEPDKGAGDDIEAVRSKEDAAVEADEGDLEDGDESKVGELVGDEDLRRLEHCRKSVWNTETRLSKSE